MEIQQESEAGFCLDVQDYLITEYSFEAAPEYEGFNLDVAEDEGAIVEDGKLAFGSFFPTTVTSAESQSNGFSLPGPTAAEVAVADVNQWKPGIGVGGFVRRRWSPVSDQTAVILGNLMLNLKKVPSRVLQELIQHLPAMPECSVTSTPFRAAAWLVRLSEGTLRGIFQKLRVWQSFI